eukprot:TRINITY_DN11013_c0_g1_i2.p1 TRINITY_DN11013_c0_g1~~TRINITY_DN11013_c0_g1_i2.p1  ORF type:complete len:504 (+),score=68.63 TRINITY_DN11013_c0_g1_i2:87-1598(+)
MKSALIGLAILVGVALAANPAMYELSTRPWLYALSQKYGQSITLLSEIPQQEFQQIKDMGFDYVWMMGVWQLGKYGLNFDQTNPALLSYYPTVLPSFTIDDVIGSPYAVVNYTCNVQLGSDEDIASLRSMLNGIGLKLMLDFVPNHSAVDCPFTSSNPDFYILAPKGTQPPYDPSAYLPNGIAYGSAGWGGAWQDTAQFNYWNPTTRKVRLQELLQVASLADAIRCDMAYLLLNDLFGQNWQQQLQSWGWTQPTTEWWADSIQAVKQQYPDVIFLAEVYDPYQQDLQNVGFDFTYDKDLYDRLKNQDINGVREWLSSNTVEFLSRSAHFISNHDQPRAANYFGSWWMADATALMTFTVPGMRFHWQWEFQGFKNQIDIHLRREEPESAVQDVQDFYQTFLNITNADVFKYGDWIYIDLSDSGTDLIAYRWEFGDDRRLCVINYSGDTGSTNVIVSNAQPINGNDTIPVTDLLSGTKYWRSAKMMQTQGLDVVVNSWYAQIFQY